MYYLQRFDANFNFNSSSFILLGDTEHRALACPGPIIIYAMQHCLFFCLVSITNLVPTIYLLVKCTSRLLHSFVMSNMKGEHIYTSWTVNAVE